MSDRKCDLTDLRSEAMKEEKTVRCSVVTHLKHGVSLEQVPISVGVNMDNIADLEDEMIDLRMSLHSNNIIYADDELPA